MLIGRGVYTLSEAHRLTGVPVGSISRWTKGYDFQYHGEIRNSPPVISTELNPIDGQPVLDFKDLLEIRFLNAFREHGVSWKSIRIATEKAKDLLQRTHPFSTKIFKTDGRTILAEFVAETGDKVLLDLVRSQYEFSKVISRYLYGGIEFDSSSEATLWYPLRRKKTIVIDPSRCFGAPITSKGRIPTRVLLNSYEANKSFEIVASWFETDLKSVRDAVTYEQGLVN